MKLTTAIILICVALCVGLVFVYKIHFMSIEDTKSRFDYSNFDYTINYPEEIFEPMGIPKGQRRYFMRDRKTGVVYLFFHYTKFAPLYDGEGKVVIIKVKK